MVSMFDWVNYLRPDVTWLKGPDSNGNYIWDETLPNQQEIIDRIAAHTSESTLPQQVPQIVTPRQIRLALVASGVSLSSIEAGINTLPEPDKSFALVTWEYAQDFKRDHPMILSLGPTLGFTSEQLDNLFILAATL